MAIPSLELPTHLTLCPLAIRPLRISTALLINSTKYTPGKVFWICVLALHEIGQLLLVSLEESPIGCREEREGFRAFCVDYDGLAIMVVV